MKRESPTPAPFTRRHFLAPPPAFRPSHVEYAVSKDLHVFMEKSFAVDGPGIRRSLKCGEEAKRQNLKIAGGLMCRHNNPLEEAVQKIHDGAIGEVITDYAYRTHGTGKTITRETLTKESKAPVVPDANGRYPIAKPVQTKVI